jgi:uncharacterized protein YndB with AHSA1/START domain/uncharacterized damage-inducible protein DinB
MKITATIHAPVAHVYNAFTNATQLCEWLCYDAQIEANTNGRLYLYWQTPKYYVMGEFLEVTANQHLKMLWQEQEHPNPNEVSITFQEENNNTHISIEFTNTISSQLENLIKRGLEVLEATQTSGYHLDIIERPMMGVLITGIVTPEAKARLGIPTDHGIILSGTIPRLSAAEAGLQGGDVLESMNDHALTAFDSIRPILAAHKAGDTVKVSYYRGETRHETKLTLKSRPIHPYPKTTQELADALTKDYAQIEQELEQAFAGISQEHANQRPSETAWSANHVLAHLITTEQENQTFIAGLVIGTELETFSSNLEARVNATLSQYPTSQKLLEVLKNTNNQTKNLIAALPNEFLQRKASVVRLQLNAEFYPVHPRQHLGQINRALSTAKGE